MSWAEVEARERAKHFNGSAITFYPNGRMKTQMILVAGAIHGLARVWRPDGTRMRETSYKNGVRHGDCITYGADDKPEQRLEFKDGRLILHIQYNKTGKQQVVRNDAAA